MTVEGEQIDNERLEIKLLLEALYLKYGYDFRDYAGAHLRRRFAFRRSLAKIPNYGEMLHRLLNDPLLVEDLLLDLSINVTEMFRDPWVYKKIREEVVPRLVTYPFIRSWHAGCSAGQEVYSMCILLGEEGVGRKRVQIYATDFNDRIIERAKAAEYSVDSVREYTKYYQLSGGKNSFSDYYRAQDDKVIIDTPLQDRVLFSVHNLATDTTFAEMNIIFCRNVLIYFNKRLQSRVLQMFYESLCPGGFLCLGTKESLRATEFMDKFDVVGEKEKIYRKKRV